MPDLHPWVLPGLLTLVILILIPILLRIGRIPDQSLLNARFDRLENGLERMDRSLREEIARNRMESTAVLETIRQSVSEQMNQMRTENVAKLEMMRQTVDEKLQSTLEKRLGESFRQVSERLEQVHRGLGEMQTLAGGVGDLKRMLTNVKARGIWGEVQLGALLEQILTAEQFVRDVRIRPNSRETVEFAIRLPGPQEDGSGEILLPIDAKFPQEDYDRLLQAAELADVVAVEQAAKALEIRIKSFAKDIRDKYIVPPYTTDFAILFLPTEGLYAEVLRRPGLCEQLQREFRIIPAGPTTLAALLNSLQMGFRTLAIQKRSSEVWETLRAVKTEFARYGDILEKVKKKLDEASSTIENEVAVRTRAISRKLSKVEELPNSPSEAALKLDLDADEESRS